ncbi:glutamine amidotransferase [Corynebacterium sp. sy017]|uniref:glutamine amidotransferase-related protein n=1 Tax=unclassified Corynebacterium TaxID=2624378 RepID=UPI001185475D|nr:MULTISPECIES: glutamine amidotransferase [unclassified Corynebacterium]MBP3087641.1 glutamine amidotransferase [Corynebacterium sp. sy017]TSD92207.1 glutamine amidotransferase [Corynebacterium sp. SY003]
MATSSAPFLVISLRSDSELETNVAQAELADIIRTTQLPSDYFDHKQLADIHTSIGDITQYKGIIVGGSSLNISTTHYGIWQQHIHRELTHLIHNPEKIPVFLICFGASWLADATGGTVDQSFSESSGPTLVELTDAGRKDPLTKTLPTTFHALTGHTENIAHISSQLTVLATGKTCPVQLIRYSDHVWASQFHAEMDAQALQTRMDFFWDYGYFSPEDYDSIVAALPAVTTTHSHAVLQNFLDFALRNQDVA